MRLLWHPEVPHLKLRTFQFEKLLAMHLPRLHAHFRQIKLAPDILVRPLFLCVSKLETFHHRRLELLTTTTPHHPQTTQWCNTLLAYCLPLPVLLRVWDVVFLDGWKALFRVCLALLQAVEQDLLPLNLEDSGRCVSCVGCRLIMALTQPSWLTNTPHPDTTTTNATHMTASSGSGRRGGTPCGGSRTACSAPRASSRSPAGRCTNSRRSST